MEFKLINGNGEEFIISPELMRWVMPGIDEMQDKAIELEEIGETQEEVDEGIIRAKELGELMRFIDESRYPQLKGE